MEAKQENNSDDQVKKFFTLLKQAQNEALISLIAESLKSQLSNQPLRVSQQILEFCKKELTKSDVNDFTRLHVSDGLVPILNGVLIERELFDAKTQSGSLEKQIERLERSPFVLKLDNHFRSIRLDSISNKDFFAALIQKYQPLLASAQDDGKDEVLDQKQAKEATKQGIKNVLMGQLGNIQTIKLSDLIDSQFLEDVDRQIDTSSFKKELKIPISDLVSQLEKNADPLFAPIAMKRQKTDQNLKPKSIIMSPVLTLALNQAENLLSPDWRKRHAAACQLKSIIQEKECFKYSIICVDEAKLTLKEGQTLSKQVFAQAIISRLLIVMLKDNFSDFEGLKVLPPVRDQCVKLLTQIVPLLKEETMTLINLLPNIFFIVENDQWHSKLNFFLILKGLVLKGDKEMKQLVLRIFGQMLIHAIPAVEDEPKVAITEVLMLVLPTYCATFSKPKIPCETMTKLIEKLTLNLVKADEISASAKAVFLLVCKVFDLRLEYPQILTDFRYRLDLKVFGAFNFHKLEPVRLSYNQLILQALEAGCFTNYVEDLELLHTLTIQSIAMETNPQILQVLFKVLTQILQIFPVENYQEYLQKDLLLDHKLPAWLNFVQPDFQTFTFIELQSFQSIEKDYFQVVFRPANEVEWDTFFNNKTKQLTHAVALMLNSGKCVNLIFDQLAKHTQIEVQEGPDCPPQPKIVLNQALLHLLFSIEQYERLLRSTQNCSKPDFEVVDYAYLQDLASQLLISDDQDISINECWHLSPLLTLLEQLIQASVKDKKLHEILLLVYDCLQDMINNQSFRCRHENFALVMDELAHQVRQQKDTQVSHLFYQLCVKYDDMLSYLGEYSLRIKACSAGILLGIGMIHKEVADPEQQASFMQQKLNDLVRPLLAQLNQERVLTLKELACDAIIDLLDMLQIIKMSGALRKVGSMIVQIAVESSINDSMTKVRYQGVDYLINKVVEKFGQSVYTEFKGMFGATVLKPTLNTEEEVRNWLKISTLFLKAQNQSRQHSFTKANKLLSSLLQKVIEESKNEEKDQELLAELVTLLFTELQDQDQINLVEAVVTQMQEKKRAAFNCLDHMLDTQIQKQSSTDFLKYLPLFILPTIKSIQIQVQIYPTEKKVMKILAKSIQILPLNLAGLDASNSFSEQLKQKISQGLDFLKVFADNQIVEDYEIKIPIQAKLRPYQLQGINWMARLGSYNLNCVLCDDMGLGKTIQSLTVVLNESKHQKIKRTNLVVCPASLTYNWLSEINKWFKGVKAAVIEGEQKHEILEDAKNYDILIINYEKVKPNLEQLLQINFFYVVLDEAHKIKNSKTVTTQSVRQIKADRKLALSGTPLQNRVSELWSLFDFILPDFLEDESTFNKTYNKYLTGNIKRMQEKLEDTQQFVTALKSLKRRIAPFILRRTKEDVLKELPPKVIQDYDCQMPEMQFAAHQLVEKSNPFQNVMGKNTNSVLQNLILHRKACNHPVLLKGLVEGLPSVQSGFQHSAKLLGLYEILQQCQIIQDQTEDLLDQAKQHRALIFCQMQSFMQIVQKDVLNKFNVPHLTLQGSMQAKERQEVVDEFNNNTQHKCLLLTTSVGGLGLTLTGADVVIFVEHDWNPMKDLQAMDRAHRIGQQKTVMVYRLIVKDTIEEKIMSLQRFKENLAKSLVQARGSEEQLVGDKQTDLNDLLKSFEEHSVYQKQTGQQQKKQASDKPLTMKQVIEAESIDQQANQLSRVCEGHDFEKY